MMPEDTDKLLAGIKGMASRDLAALGRRVGEELKGAELTSFFGEVMQQLSTENRKDLLVQTAQRLPEAEKKDAVKETMAQLSEPQRKEVLQDLRGMAQPNPKTRDSLWMVVVTAFAVVLVGSFVAIAIAMFTPNQGSAMVKPELVLTMFTSVVGFLAGLFVPSPSSGKPQ